jgi:hypothetical protein
VIQDACPCFVYCFLERILRLGQENVCEDGGRKIRRNMRKVQGELCIKGKKDGG